MKYVRFYANNQVMYGVLEGETIKQLDGDFIHGNTKPTDTTFNRSEVKLLPPVEPNKVIAIGLNYAGHAEERGKAIPEEPMMFMVSPSAVISDGEEIRIPHLEHRTDFEAELAVVIGKEAKDVKKEEALSYVLGYTCCNDISDRDLQKNDGQFTRAKSYSTFKPLGPVIETELDPNNVEIKLSVNGEIKQHSNTNDLIHDVQSIIENITEVIALKPGDTIITGTPSGVAPIKPGDEVEMEIEGIGKLKNSVTSSK